MPSAEVSPKQALPAYAELHCLSNYSFLRGASRPEELAARAAALGYTAVAITDECSVAGVVRAHVEAKTAGLRLIIGSEIAFQDDLPGGEGRLRRLVMLAQNREGYARLCELITIARRRAPKGSYDARLSDLSAGLAECLVLWLPGRPDLFDSFEGQCTVGHWLNERFADHLWVAAEMHLHPHDRERAVLLRALADRTGIPIVAAGDVHMHVRSRRALQDVLTAVRIGKPVAQAGKTLFPNGERHLRPRHKLAQLYRPEWMAETLKVAALCSFSLDELRYEYPAEVVPAGMTATQHLRNLTETGALERFPQGVAPSVRAQIEHELTLIADLGYEHYFLTVEDIVRFARSQGILCQGRGSAANSAVCYCLHVTEVDPGRMSMLFERFISKERNEPPDIDIDFDAERREEVIQYIYRKYGRERAALTANVITYRPRSAVRDVGKALGLAPDQVDKLAKTLSWWDSREVLTERMREAGFDPDNRAMRLLIRLVNLVVGFPRHLSQHPGGFVLASRRLSEMVPVENASMENRTVIQWDKDDLDALGLLKIDVLGLGMLNALSRAMKMIGEYRGTPFWMQDIPAEDPAVYDMLCAGDSVGVFQVESRAQMAMLPRLAPRKFYDLVTEVAIVRPGPIQGGMVHPYLKRRQGLEPITYPSEEIKGVLERTLGVVIFQEQCMQVAMVAAGFTAGRADQLRRAMAAWKRRGGLEPFREELLQGMRDRNYKEDFALQIYQQLQGFAAYGFPESHAASFALIVYASSWAKRHEPAAFLAGLLNAWPMGFYAPAQLVQDAKRHGVEVRKVDVAISVWDCNLERTEKGPAVRLGLRMINGMKEEAAQRLKAARASCPFEDVQDLALRASLDRGDLNALAKAGAIASLAGHRRDAIWQVTGVEEPTPVLSDPTREDATPILVAPTEGQDIVADYNTVGLTLGRHPLSLLRPLLRQRRLLTAVELKGRRHGSLARTTGIVTHRQRPETAKGVIFITLEDETGHINVVVWNAVAERQRVEMLGAKLLTVYGTWETDGRVHHLIAGHLKDDTALLGNLGTTSRDFR